ncbi:MAG: hypothetical protein HFH41_10540 [Lachnospiraceae bacterium]|nr:hypothetical protein [Lachnospiraceae bacterium]
MQNANLFYQKNALVTIMMARDIVNKEPGDKMIPIAEYERSCGFSRWTIQTAIKTLLDNDCMVVEKYGPKGTFLSKINYEKLWTFTDWDPLLGCVPVSTSCALSGLLTGTNIVLKQKGIPFNFSFMTPVKNRLLSLDRGRCNFVITTKLAYEIGKEMCPNIRLAMELKNCKYNLGYSVYYNTERFQGVEDGMSIGIYESALEQKYLSNLICEGKKVEKKYLYYHETYNAFARGEIDMVVQRSDCEDYRIYREKSVGLSYLGLDETIMTPVVLVNKDDYGIEELIKNNINIAEMAAIQEKVMQGKMEPSYY